MGKRKPYSTRRKIKTREKTTTPDGKRDYMRGYMRMRRKEVFGDVSKLPKSTAEAIGGPVKGISGKTTVSVIRGDLGTLAGKSTRKVITGHVPGVSGKSTVAVFRGKVGKVKPTRKAIGLSRKALPTRKTVAETIGIDLKKLRK